MSTVWPGVRTRVSALKSKYGSIAVGISEVDGAFANEHAVAGELPVRRLTMSIEPFMIGRSNVPVTRRSAEPSMRASRVVQNGHPRRRDLDVERDGPRRVRRRPGPASGAVAAPARRSRARRPDRSRPAWRRLPSAPCAARRRVPISRGVVSGPDEPQIHVHRRVEARRIAQAQASDRPPRCCTR